MERVELVEGFPAERWDALVALAGRTAPFDAAYTRSQLETRSKVLCSLAWVDGELAGYKLGYEERPRYFESWIGAVAPEFRRRGLAARMMEAQHRWCREQGFKWVTTLTEGSNQPMLIANLQAGFEVCGTFLDRRKILKVLLQKPLD